MTNLSSLLKSFRNNFSLDPRSVGLFRILLGALVLVDLWIRLGDLRAHYSDSGVLPGSEYVSEFMDPMWWSVHLAEGNTELLKGLFVVHAIFALSLLLGYRSKLSCLVCWLLMVSLHNRNPMVLHGGDILFRLLLFWGWMLPLGSRFSLDALLADGTSIVEEGWHYSAATAGFVLQVCFVYWFNFLHKWHPVWHEGHGVAYALRADQFTTGIAEVLLSYPTLTTALNYGVLGLELLGPFLLFIPVYTTVFRSLAVLVFTSFHLGLFLVMTLGLFPLIAVATWLAFLPGAVWNRLARMVPDWRLPTALRDRLRSVPSVRWLPFSGSGPLAHLAVGALVLYLLAWNVETLEGGDVPYFDTIVPVGKMLRIDQEWDMFSPYPFTYDGWYVIKGKLRNGRTIDLFSNGGPAGEGKPLSWERPEDVSDTYRNMRWRKYMLNLSFRRYTKYRPYYADYLCRSWNRNHSGECRLVSVKIFFVVERTVEGGEYREGKDLLWHLPCDTDLEAGS